MFFHVLEEPLEPQQGPLVWPLTGKYKVEAEKQLTQGLVVTQAWMQVMIQPHTLHIFQASLTGRLSAANTSQSRIIQASERESERVETE